MFVDFEGIDGSGKTTLSNRVAARLREEGLEVVHAREGGDLPSEVARRIRALTRDAGSLELEPLAELLLYSARDAQVIEAVIRPALARGAVVIADRYLHSHLALSVAGRGLPEATVRQVLDSVAGGLWPDLVVVVDVDPELARLRKRASRLGQRREEESGRKGLSGASFQERIRRHFLAQAEGDRGRYLVLRNEEASLETLETRVVEEVRLRRQQASVRGTPMVPSPRAQRFPTAPLELGGADKRDRLVANFLESVRSLAEGEPATAALFLGEADGDEAWALRDALEERAPAAVIRALSDRGDARALEVRERLIDAAPLAVARSLDRIPGLQADALRRRLVDRHPAEIAAGLEGLADEGAWELRGRLWPVVPEAVLLSLAGLDDSRAWSMRRAACAEESSADAIAASLAGLDGERAWALRSELRAAPLAQIRSVRGCISEQAWELRERWIARAPKPVLKGTLGIDHERAWALRFETGAIASEALDSIAGMGGPRASVLRRELAPLWPAAALRSLHRPLVGEDEDFFWGIVAGHGGHPAVLRAAALLLDAGDPK